MDFLEALDKASNIGVIAGSLAAILGGVSQWLIWRTSERAAMRRATVIAANSIIFHAFQLWMFYVRASKMEEYWRALEDVGAEDFRGASEGTVANVEQSFYEFVHDHLSEELQDPGLGMDELDKQIQGLARNDPSAAIAMRLSIRSLYAVNYTYQNLGKMFAKLDANEQPDEQVLEELRSAIGAIMTEKVLENLGASIYSLLELSDRRTRRRMRRLMRRCEGENDKELKQGMAEFRAKLVTKLKRDRGMS